MIYLKITVYSQKVRDCGVCLFIHVLSHRGLGAGKRPQEYGHAGLIFTQERRGHTLGTVLSHTFLMVRLCLMNGSKIFPEGIH